MSELSKKYKRVINNVEDNLKNKEDIDFVKEQIQELVNHFNSEMEHVEKLLTNLTDRQNNIENKMNEVQNTMESIQKELYLDNEYDLEIVCPYCNCNFVLDSDETQDEVECPECNNVIEIDWDGESFDDGCSGSCGSCAHGCMCDEDETKLDENEDDM